MINLKRLLLVLVVVILAACNTVEPAPSQVPTTVVQDVTPTFTPAVTSAMVTTTPTTPALTATQTASPSATVKPTLIYPAEGYGPNNFPTDINPLTGLQVSDPSVLNRRPISVKINIVPRTGTRPPWGLSMADIVFDYYHNDGYTRFHAIFYGNDTELMGPIRSGRLLDEPLVQMFKSIFVYGGADARIEYRFFSSNISSRLVREGSQSTCPPTNESALCRYDPNGYDFLLAGTKEIHKYIQARGMDDTPQNLDGMVFKLNLPAGGSPGSQIFTRYSGDDYNRWDYDPSTGSYLRFQDDIFDQGQGEKYMPLLDRNSNEQISVANVVVLLVTHQYFVPPPGEIVDILLNGSGTAYAFRDGKVYKIKWNRTAQDGIIFLTFEDGSRYPMKPGNIWYQIVGQSSTIAQPADSAWRFEFVFP